MEAQDSWTPKQYTRCSLSIDGRYQAAASVTGENHHNNRPCFSEVRTWDARTGHSLQPILRFDDEMVHSLAFSPGNKLLFQLASRLYDDRQPRNKTTLRLLAWAIEGEAAPAVLDFILPGGMIFSPDGKLILSSNSVLELENGSIQSKLEGGECRCFSPDGRVVATTGGWDPAIQLWDVKTGQLRATLESHADPVICLAFSRDGQRLISVDDKGTVKIWSAEFPN